MFRRSGSWMRLYCSVLAMVPALASADSVNISANSDNTLYENPLGSVSNGNGIHLFIGRTSLGGGNRIRRALVRFDVAGSIPAGSTIDSVALTVSVSKVSNLTSRPARLHTVLADWGEGASDAAFEEGQGIAAAAGDATWLHRFSPGTNWAAAGGDFAAASVATVNITLPGTYTWTSTAAMVADVQNWLDNPAANFGWMVRGEEAVADTAKRFGSRHQVGAANRPVLVVQYTPNNLNVCCIDGECESLDETACGLAGGVHLGMDGCDNEVCAIGACCEPDLCTDLAGFACAAAGGQHFAGVLCTDEDCNNNGILDQCDVDQGISPDVNENGVPDECECVDVDLFGDVNHDATVDIFDILCVLDGFAGVFVDCAFADVDLMPCGGDGLIDVFDILGVLDAFAGNSVCLLCP